MTKDETKRKAWTKPEIKEIGKLKDVAGQDGSITQGQPSRS